MKELLGSTMNAKSPAPAINEPLIPPSPQDARISVADSDFESILVETPGCDRGLETFPLKTSVLPTNVSSILKGLLPRRDRIQLLPGGLFQLKDKANYEGALAAIVGTEENSPCHRCSTNDGPWAGCFTVKDLDGKPLLDGSCAGCHYGGLGVECSFRDSFPHGGSEDTSPSRRRSNRDRGFQSEAESTATSMQLPSPQQVQSLSPSRQNSTTLRQRTIRSKTTAVATRQKHKRKAAKIQQRGRIDYKKELIKVNKLVCGDLDMSDEALQVMNDFVNDMFNQVAEEAAAITIREKKTTLSAGAIKTAFRLQLSGLRRQTAEYECDAAMAMWRAHGQ